MKKLPEGKVYYSITEISELTKVKPHVLRYWESEFPALSPKKNRAGNRVYQGKDIKLIFLIKHLLYEQKFTIAGAKNKLEDRRKKKAGADGGPRQMKMEFNPAERDEIIKHITGELKEILEILDKDP